MTLLGFVPSVNFYKYTTHSHSLTDHEILETSDLEISGTIDHEIPGTTDHEISRTTDHEIS